MPCHHLLSLLACLLVCLPQEEPQTTSSVACLTCRRRRRLPGTNVHTRMEFARSVTIGQEWAGKWLRPAHLIPDLLARQPSFLSSHWSLRLFSVIILYWWVLTVEYISAKIFLFLPPIVCFLNCKSKRERNLIISPSISQSGVSFRTLSYSFGKKTSEKIILFWRKKICWPCSRVRLSPWCIHALSLCNVLEERRGTSTI